MRQDGSTNRGRMDRTRARTGTDYERGERERLTSSEYCAVCNLTFGSQERRVSLDEKAAHAACAMRVRKLEAA